MLEVDRHINDILIDKLSLLEAHFDADALFYYGVIHPGYIKLFRDFIEELAAQKPPRKRLAILLNTNGGDVETAEKMVQIMRYHYNEVYFIVPDYAMSAGTILCMSGNKIYMDYSSSLGPIDPQLRKGEGKNLKYVPALGYLDKMNELVEKSANDILTPAELAMLLNMDLAELRQYEQARDLSVVLLKTWLVKYKFNDWTTHRTNPKRKGQAVTKADKNRRATTIAKKLSDNKIWRSHSRNIDIEALKELRLEIGDYSSDNKLRELIRSYNDVILDYLTKNGWSFYLHSKIF